MKTLTIDLNRLDGMGHLSIMEYVQFLCDSHGFTKDKPIKITVTPGRVLQFMQD